MIIRQASQLRNLPRSRFPARQRRRLSSASLDPFPVDIQQWICDLTARPKVFSTDTVDILRTGHLLRTLPTRQTDPIPLPKEGDELSKAHHMVLFQPETMLSDLAEDGSSPEYNAPPPYLRRMWASGSMTWNPRNPLRVGSKVLQAVSVSKAELKAGMLFVHQARDLYMEDLSGGEVDEDSWALKEIRTHVFRKEVLSKNKQVLNKAQSLLDTMPDPDVSFTFTPTPPLLFRYSALTFNPHRIHYDNHWTQEVECHPDLLMHGPLTATLLVEVAGQAALRKGRQLVDFKYRATNPLYVSREVELRGSWANGGKLDMAVVQEGRVGMTASFHMV